MHLICPQIAVTVEAIERRRQMLQKFFVEKRKNGICVDLVFYGNG